MQGAIFYVIIFKGLSALEGKMADINEYFKDKYEEEFSDSLDDKTEEKDLAKKESKIVDTKEEFERKLRRHRRLNLYRIIIAVVIVLVLIGAAYFNYQSMVYTSYDETKKITYMESTNAKYLEFNGNVLRYSQDGASAFNISNDMIWNETFEMQNPIADTCGDFVALGDYMGTTIYVYNSEGLKGTIDTSTPLRSFCVSGTGSVAVVLEEDEVTWVKLYDYNGMNIASDRTTMAKSGYPVRIDISEDGILLAISYLFVDSGVLSSSVAYYNFGAVGQNEIDNLVSGYTYSNTVVSYVDFMNSDTAFAVGDDRFLVFKGSQKPEVIMEKELEGEVLSVFNSENYVALVYEDENGTNQYKADIYNDEGNLVCTQGFDLEYTNITFYKDLIIIYNSEECEIYNTSGLKKFEGPFEESVILLIPESKAKHLLVSGDCMKEIKLN